MFWNDLKKLLPQYDFEYKSGKHTVKENSVDSKVKEVIWDKSDFQCIDPQIAKDLSGFFQRSKAAGIFRLDCDGAFLVQSEDKAYLFLIELKSSFIPCHIYKASNQIISTYIKLNMILGLLPNYIKGNIKVKGFIFSRPCEEKSLRDLDRSNLLPPNNKYITETELTKHFIKNKGKNITIKPNQCHRLKDVPLGSNALFDELELYHIDVEEPNTSITMDTSEFL
ncbi:hypothetical protein [Prevotella falsenii]|uniref:hypothetical protein n=1 Tax=Prevotella falsenii TaxID=515414 RepID=UPI0004699C1E|nr:hypothetical protein [Prevotella falsenii]